MPKTIPPFIFNDESIFNSYGFKILTEGISLERFNTNPVMLDQHYNATWAVIGKWTETQKVSGVLMGKPIFDSEDEDAKKMEGKVERGFIKAASMGITFNREDLQIIDGDLTLVRCELYEVSIVAIPSNANAIRLYAENGELMKEEEIKNLCLSMAQKKPTRENLNLNITMKKILLSVSALMALGLDNQPEDGTEVAVVEAKILALSTANATLKKEKEGLELAAKTTKDAQELAKKQALTETVDLAVTQGKITADSKEKFVQLGLHDSALLKSTLEAIPAKQNFGAGLKNPDRNGATTVATMDDFQKLSIEEQFAFKNDRPEEYKKLFS
jgi:phage head maturation protease